MLLLPLADSHPLLRKHLVSFTKYTGEFGTAQKVPGAGATASASSNHRELVLAEGDTSARIMIQKVLPELLKSVSSPEVRKVLEAYSWEYVGSHPGDYYDSFMKPQFHPAPGTPWLPSLMRDLEWIGWKGNLSPFPTEVTPAAVHQWLESAKEVVGIVGVTGFVRTSNQVEEARRGQKPVGYRARKSAPRKTCRAHFNLLPMKELRATGSPFKHSPDRIRAIKCLATLEGRLYLWKDAWLSAKTLPMAKTGLVSVLADQFITEMSGSWESFAHEFPATYSLLVVCCSVLSERKAFTLESQKQGALNPHMEQLLALARETESAAMRVVALFLPVREVFDLVSVEDAATIYHVSMAWLGELAGFLEEQWSKGVAKCSRRLMRVPPRGAGVNSTGYNAAADTWQNLRRFQSVSSQRAGIVGAPVILKVLQLIADDQFRIGNASVNPNTHAYKEVTSAGVLPWHAVLHPESFDTCRALTVLLEACRTHKLSMDSWVGIAKLRSGEVSKPVDMICGCAVPSMSPECADFLKGVGLFGAGPWTGT